MGSFSPDGPLHVDAAVPKELLQQIVGMLLSYWEEARSKDTPVVKLRNDVQLRDEFERAGVPLGLADVQVWRRWFTTGWTFAQGRLRYVDVLVNSRRHMEFM